MSFKKYYFVEDEIKTLLALDEKAGKGGVAGPIGRFLANKFRKVKKVGVRPNWFSVIDKLDQVHYAEAMSKLIQAWDNKVKIGKKKVMVNDLKQGVITGSDEKAFAKLGDFATDNETLKEFPPNIPVYTTSNGAKFAMFDLPAEDAKSASDRIYAFGMNGKANKLFQELFKSTYKDWKVLSSFKQGGLQGQQAGPRDISVIDLDQKQYKELVPEDVDISDLDIISEKKTNKPLVRVDDEWYDYEEGEEEDFYKDKKSSVVIEPDSKKFDYQAVDLKGFEDEGAKKELDKELGIVSKEEPEETPAEDPKTKMTDGYKKKLGELYNVTVDKADRKNSVSVKEIMSTIDKYIQSADEKMKGLNDSFNKSVEAKDYDQAEKDGEAMLDYMADLAVKKPEEKEPDESPAEEKPADEKPKEDKTKGVLANKIKKDLDGEPQKIPATGNVKSGWTYPLKNGGKLYAYVNKQGEHKLAFNALGKEVIDKTKLLPDDAVAALK